MTIPTPDEIERFRAKQIVTDAQSCYGWSGSRCPGTGYAQGFYSRKSGRSVRKYFAHQLAYELAYGPVPDGLSVLHRCGTKTCSNPVHLYAGDARQNAADMRAHGGSNRPVLTPRDVLDIMALKGQGAKHTELAAKFRVSNQSIANILAGRTYASITGIAPNRRESQP
jgi:hypothetical protein